jgi:hypothetical protein
MVGSWVEITLPRHAPDTEEAEVAREQVRGSLERIGGPEWQAADQVLCPGLARIVTAAPADEEALPIVR